MRGCISMRRRRVDVATKVEVGEGVSVWVGEAVDVAEASDARDVGVIVPSPAGGSRQPASPEPQITQGQLPDTAGRRYRRRRWNVGSNETAPGLFGSKRHWLTPQGTSILATRN